MKTLKNREIVESFFQKVTDKFLCEYGEHEIFKGGLFILMKRVFDSVDRYHFSNEEKQILINVIFENMQKNLKKNFAKLKKLRPLNVEIADFKNSDKRNLTTRNKKVNVIEVKDNTEELEEIIFEKAGKTLQ